MQVAERTYRAWKRAQPSARDFADAVVIDAILATRVDQHGQATPESMCGRRKMTALLRRQCLAVSKRQVDRLMRDLDINGLVRGKGTRTTIPDRDAARAPDLLDRNFTAPAPNRRWVADFTYVRTWAGFVYVSFVIDCYSRAIVGWHAATTKTTPLVTTALRMGLWRRDRASPRRLVRSATRTTTPSRNRRSGCSRTRRSGTDPRSDQARCGPSTTSNGSPRDGSTGTTHVDCTPPSETSHPTSTRPRTTLTSKHQPTRRWHPHRSGREPGTVHPAHGVIVNRTVAIRGWGLRSGTTRLIIPFNVEDTRLGVVPSQVV